MLKELSNREKGYTIIILVLMVGCYNAYTLFEYVDYKVSFPFYKSHSEPLDWYLKDIGGRVSIFLLSVLYYNQIQDRLNWKYTILIRATVGFLAKDILDYVVSYDQFTAFWDIIAYIGIILYVLFKR